jgi:ATP-binding cassette subfamily F protein 3
MPLLTIADVCKFYGADEILTNVSFRMEPRERVGLVGANGSGKSTLLRIIAGLESANGGSISVARNVIVTYVSQHARFEGDQTLWGAMLEAFAAAIEAQAEMRRLEEFMLAASNDTHRRAELEARYKRASAVAEHAGYDYESRIERVLTGLELAKEDWTRPASLLSGGQKTRANLARALLSDSDLLLLDEPTNHLDIGAIQWLESFLTDRRRSFMVVAHDRHFLDAVCTRTLELVNGSVDDYAAAYSRFVLLRAERRALAQRLYEEQQAEIAKTEEYIRRYGSGQRAKEAKGRQKRLDRVPRLQRPTDNRAMSLRLHADRRQGDVALDMVRVTVGHGSRPIVRLPEHVTLIHGARIAIVGANGSGKTTLARTVVGEIPPLAGSLTWAPGTKPAYYNQAPENAFPPGTSVLDAFRTRYPVSEEDARGFLGRFLFHGEDVFKATSSLSGGESSRLALACLIHAAPNVLLLDEPTNHLDIDGREALEAALNEFKGTLLVISHDRYLIERLGAQIWHIEDGQLRIHDGPLSALFDRRARNDRSQINHVVQPKAANPVETSSRRLKSVSRRARRTWTEPAIHGVITRIASNQDRARPLIQKLAQEAADAPPNELSDLTGQYAAIVLEMESALEELVGALHPEARQ